jgi:hypothetical protein
VCGFSTNEARAVRFGHVVEWVGRVVGDHVQVTRTGSVHEVRGFEQRVRNHGQYVRPLEWQVPCPFRQLVPVRVMTAAVAHVCAVSIHTGGIH